MQITLFRPLQNDISMIESTWHHVPQAEGVRLQSREELEPALTNYQHNRGHSLLLRFVEQRRIVKGTFHPGRKILPASAITYELVYDCILPSDVDVSDDDLWNRLRNDFNRYEVRGTLKRGNVTDKEEEKATA